MNRVIRWGLTAALGAALAACAAGPQRIAQTPSGYPEVTIHNSEVAAVKGELVDRMQDSGYFLADESSFRLTFTRDVQRSDESLFRLASGGNPYRSGRKLEIAYTVSPDGNRIRIVGYPVYAVVFDGVVTRRYGSDEVELFNQTQGFLASLKTDMEAQQVSKR